MALNLLVWSNVIIHLWWFWSTEESTFNTRYPTFQSPPVFTLQVQNIQKFSRILFISLQIFVKIFVSINCWFIVQFNISLYRINTFDNFLKWVVYINTLQSPFIACKGMKNCWKFLYNLVTTAHFTDRNWISKSVYYSTVHSHHRSHQTMNKLSINRSLSFLFQKWKT